MCSRSSARRRRFATQSLSVFLSLNVLVEVCVVMSCHVPVFQTWDKCGEAGRAVLPSRPGAGLTALQQALQDLLAACRKLDSLAPHTAPPIRSCCASCFSPVSRCDATQTVATPQNTCRCCFPQTTARCSALALCNFDSVPSAAHRHMQTTQHTRPGAGQSPSCATWPASWR